MIWRIELLGNIRVARGGETITRFESRKVVALLARVALAPERLHPREELAALLWPDADRGVGLERLRHVLSSLQRQLALPDAPLLQIDRSAVRLNRDAASCDAVEFEALARRRQHAAAKALYAGDLLPGFYDDWIQEERERLRALFDGLPETDASAPPTPPRPRAAPALPGYLTAFFGRERERAELERLLAERRLVTLLGPGGCGKTRLAVETARALADRFARIAFVPLVDCVDPDRIPDRVRVALRLPPVDAPALEQLDWALADAPTLLVLDNAEQLATGADAALEALLGRLPQVRCLVTSRRPLQVPGEQAFFLEPLSTPDSVALFVDRARSARPDFQLTDSRRADLIELCGLLEGLPLALELAASRIRVHPLPRMRRQIASEGRRFPLLARQESHARKDPRHGSLHAAIAWSWNLLTPRQQDFLAALSVLRGHWRAELAAAIQEVPDALPALEELVAHSLVRIDHDTDTGVRFALMESIRAFAAERLSPERRGALHRRFAEAVRALLADPDAHDLVEEDDLPALQAAIECALDDGSAGDALGLCAAFEDLWLRIGHAADALALIDRARQLPGGDPRERVSALGTGVLLSRGAMDLALGDSLADAARDAAGADPAARAVATLAQARAAYRRRAEPGRVAALLEEALTRARAVADPGTEADAQNLLGLLANRRQDFDAAEAHLDAAQRLWESHGRRQRANLVRMNRGMVAVDRGALALGRERYQRCLEIARALDDRNLMVKIHNNVGLIRAREERWTESRDAFLLALELARTLGSRFGMALALWNLAEPLAFLGHERDAARLLGFSERSWSDYSALTEDDRAYLSRVRARIESALTAEEAAQLYESGAALTLPQALERAGK